MEAIKTVRSEAYGLNEGLSTGESEAGDGPGGLGRLFRATVLERILGVEEVYVDYEGANPTGTHKDRIALAHVGEAVKRGFSGITVGTCGNYGVAVAYYASLTGLRVRIFVPKDYTLERLPEMKAFGAEIVEVPGTYEEAVAASRAFAGKNDFYDANPGSNRAVDMRAYSEMALWIASRVNPTAVFVPLGNGTTMAGLWEGFKAAGLAPRMVGVTTAFGNEILRRFYGDGNGDFAETELNEPLVSERSFDADGALKAVRESNGYVFGFADDSALGCAELMRVAAGIRPLPASALVLAGLVKFVRKFNLRNGRFVLVVTGGVRVG